MRTLFIALSAIVFFMSCDIVNSNMDYPRFSSPDEALLWVSQNISFVYDIDAHGTGDFWQGPRDTLKRRTGDCEDFAILASWLIKKNFNINTTIIVATHKINGNCHAMLNYNNQWLSVQIYRSTEPKDQWYINHEYTLDMILLSADSKSLK